MTAVGAILLVVTLFVYLFAVADIGSMHGSDAAGNGMSQAFGYLSAVALWVLLAVLLLIAGVKGEMPGWAKVAAVILHPASGVAALAAVALLIDRNPKVPGMIVVPAVAPLLMIGYAIWAWFPALRTAIAPNHASVIAWGGVLLLTLAPLPLFVGRSARLANTRAGQQQTYQNQIEKAREERLAEFNKLTQDSPLSEWIKFADHTDELRPKAMEAISRLERREADAEAMLDKGDPYPLLEIEHLSLAATPSFCRKALKFLHQRAEEFKPAQPQQSNYDRESGKIEKFWPSMRWLAENGCKCSGEIDFLEEVVRMYADTPMRKSFIDTLEWIRQRQ